MFPACLNGVLPLAFTCCCGGWDCRGDNCGADIAAGAKSNMRCRQSFASGSSILLVLKQIYCRFCYQLLIFNLLLEARLFCCYERKRLKNFSIERDSKSIFPGKLKQFFIRFSWLSIISDFYIPHNIAEQDVFHKIRKERKKKAIAILFSDNG